MNDLEVKVTYYYEINRLNPRWSSNFKIFIIVQGDRKNEFIS